PLLRETIKVLEESRSFIIEPDLVAKELLKLIEENKLIEDNHKLYINSLYAAEWGIATSVKRLMENSEKIQYSGHNIKKEIRKMEKRLGIQYGQSQVEAIEEAL